MVIALSYLAVVIGFGITQAALYLHEFFHWVFIVPFAGISEGAFNSFYHSIPFFPTAFLLGALGVFLYWRWTPLRPR